jgi:GMP synthase (glutamine-hydrolysing)
MSDRILILDFGSQVTQLIARRVRECGVYSEIRPYNISAEEIVNFAPKGIILSGGPASVHLDFSPRADARIFDLGVPILGICYGEQLLCEQLGGKVEAGETREFGLANVEIIEYCDLFYVVWAKGRSQEL